MEMSDGGMLPDTKCNGLNLRKIRYSLDKTWSLWDEWKAKRQQWRLEMNQSNLAIRQAKEVDAKRSEIERNQKLLETEAMVSATTATQQHKVEGAETLTKQLGAEAEKNEINTTNMDNQGSHLPTRRLPLSEHDILAIHSFNASEHLINRLIDDKKNQFNLS